jgi:hypothetical protein
MPVFKVYHFDHRLRFPDFRFSRIPDQYIFGNADRRVEEIQRISRISFFLSPHWQIPALAILET